MTKTSRNGRDLLLPTTGHHKIRLLIEEPGSGWKAVAVESGQAIYRGELSVPEWAGKVVRVAVAYIDADEGKPVALSRLAVSTWTIGDDGYCDQADQMRHIIEKIDGVVGGDGNTPVTQDDTEAIKRCLELSEG